mmetsp:Transcript_14451/g.23061  ORF Transcript_14451/g.23061 Transcript_14451/m.23061 type:complete len:460 (-) Transcript_14451:30-1409(-)
MSSVRISPCPRAPPKGLAGIWEGYEQEPNSILDTSAFSERMVLLNVYDVSDGAFERINKITTANNNILVGGVFHAGVEVYGKEWCYGVTEYGRSGVCAIYPRSHPQHTYRCTVPIGETPLKEEEVVEICRQLSQEWLGHEYDLIHRNCCSFCNVMLKDIVPGGRNPGWVDRAARAGATIDILSKKVVEEMPVQASETIKSLKRESLKTLDAAREESAKALEAARVESEKLAEKASQHMNILGERLSSSSLGTSLWEWGEGLRATAQRGLEEQEIPPEISEHAQALRRKSQAFGDEVGEKAQALSSSLWQWGQNLQASSVWGLAEEATTNLQASVSSLVDGKTASSSSFPAPQISTKGLLEEDDDLLLDSGGYSAEDPDSLGLIKSAEEKHLKQGLLEEEDEDEDNLLDVRDAATAKKEIAGSLPIVEAPLEWSSPACSNDEETQHPSPPAYVDPLDLLA